MAAATGVSRPDPDVLQRLRRDRLPIAEIGQKLGMSRSATYLWLRRYEIGLNASTTQGELVKAWQTGDSVAAIAKRSSLSTSAIRERLVAASVLRLERPYTKVGASADPLTEEFLRQHFLRERWSVERVAEASGTTVRQVRYRLELFGLSRLNGDSTGVAECPRPKRGA